MKNARLRSPCEKVDGLVYFGRMVDQVRAHAKGNCLPSIKRALEKVSTNTA
jgi:hypothetical protein